MKDSMALLVFFAIAFGLTGVIYKSAHIIADASTTKDVSKDIPVTIVNSERFTTFGGGTATKRRKNQSKSKGIKRKSHKKH
jgi:hypothetical protein